ncbi:MAG: zinc metallopeptidase [Bacteroidales bacterium]|nr:zinc metallopeptidase [Bacteroidales bacterium]
MNGLFILLQTTTHAGNVGSAIYWIVFIGLMILSGIVSRQVQSKFKKYSKIAMNYGMTGREVAEKMLYDNDIRDVKIQMVQGTLTDHYNPTNKTLNLSPDVYRGTSVAAAAVAAHECGHAVQHATAYRWLTMRSRMVPAVSFTSRWVSWVLLAGILLVNIFPGLLLVGIAMFAISTLFSVVTLPVEIDASKRALVWLNTHNVTSPDTHPYAESALRSAAYTYVVAALTSLATLLYYVMIYLNNRN